MGTQEITVQQTKTKRKNVSKRINIVKNTVLPLKQVLPRIQIMQSLTLPRTKAQILVKFLQEDKVSTRMHYIMIDLLLITQLTTSKIASNSWDF